MRGVLNKLNIFLGCTKSKLKGKQKAKDLYIASDMFRGRLAYANKLKSQSGGGKIKYLF